MAYLTRRTQRGLRALLPRPVAGQDRHERVAAVAEHELAEEGVGVALQAEDRVQAALAVGVQQLEGVVAAVVDDDIAGGEGGEVGQGGAAFVAMGVQVEVDREAGAQLVKGGCKNVVGGRLKQSGMRWTKDGADAILALRCCVLSGRYEDFWEWRSDPAPAAAV